MTAITTKHWGVTSMHSKCVIVQHALSWTAGDEDHGKQNFTKGWVGRSTIGTVLKSLK